VTTLLDYRDITSLLSQRNVLARTTLEPSSGILANFRDQLFPIRSVLTVPRGSELSLPGLHTFKEWGFRWGINNPRGIVANREVMKDQVYQKEVAGLRIMS